MRLGTLLLIGAIKRDKLIKLGGGESMRRVRILVLAVILIAIVCAGISLYAYQHNKRAEENTIDIIKDFTGKEEVDVSGQSRKPIDSMTLYDGGVLEIYTETQFKGKDTLNIPAKYEKKKVKTVQILSQLEQTSYYLKHIVLEDGIEELEFQGCPNLETVVFPPSIKKIDTRHFKNLKKQITIYVTKDSYAEKWAKKHHFSYRYGTTGKE